MAISKKTCTKCGIEKFADEFYKRKDSKDGLLNDCKSCRKNAVRIYASNNPEKKKALHAAWYAANKVRAGEKRRTWQAANKAKACGYSKKWRDKNRDISIPKKERTLIVGSLTERMRIYRTKWLVANKDKARASTNAWFAKNPEARRRHNHNRRARKLAVGGKLSKGLAEKLFKLQRGKCACGCKQQLGDDFHLDHRMPLALGGTNTDDNMQLLRSICNRQKSAKHPIEFMQSRGFLL